VLQGPAVTSTFCTKIHPQPLTWRLGRLLELKLRSGVPPSVDMALGARYVSIATTQLTEAVCSEERFCDTANVTHGNH
jgi:hypothetical protein